MATWLSRTIVTSHITRRIGRCLNLYHTNRGPAELTVFARGSTGVSQHCDGPGSYFWTDPQTGALTNVQIGKLLEKLIFPNVGNPGGLQRVGSKSPSLPLMTKETVGNKFQQMVNGT